METHSIKPKRHRRTKAEMAYDKMREELKLKETGKDIGKSKKKAHKSNLEAEPPILDTPSWEEETKQISGWVNVYKDGKSYWLGSDIHYTIEEAKKAGGHATIKQIHISFEDN